jgi:hypothetical protein
MRDYLVVLLLYLCQLSGEINTTTFTVYNVPLLIIRGDKYNYIYSIPLSNIWGDKYNYIYSIPLSIIRGDKYNLLHLQYTCTSVKYQGR